MSQHAPGCKAFRYPDTVKCTCGAAKREASAASAPAGEPIDMLDAVRKGLENMIQAREREVVKRMSEPVKEPTDKDFMSAHIDALESMNADLLADRNRLFDETTQLQARLHALEAENATRRFEAWDGLAKRAEVAEAHLSALRTALEALEKKWRVKQDPGVLSELGLRAQRERVRCADDLAAVLRTQEPT